MKYKIIPFDAKMAKDIQDGKIKGKIKYSENNGYAYDADIIKFDLIADKSRAKPNSTLFRTIAAIIEFDDYQGIRTFNTDGYGCNHIGDDTKLYLEVPDNEPMFKPFDKVLVREDSLTPWQAAFFSHIESFEDGNRFAITTSGDNYNLANNEILPYEGNEHLVGTTDKPTED